MNKSFNLNKLIRSNIAKLEPYSAARNEYADWRHDITYLDANENPFDNGENRYPDPQQIDLKKAFSKLKGIQIERILLGNGSDEVLDLIMRAFVEPGVESIMTLPPTYGMYGVLADINNITNLKVPLNPNFKMDLDVVLAAITSKTKIVFLCSPNNPTGNSISETKIERLLNEFSGLVVIDEAYIEFSEQASWTKRLDEFPNLIITQTLSKAYGMAGIRLGICYASAEIISVLNKIKPPYNVNVLTQKRALKRLLNMSQVKKEIRKIKANKLDLFEALNDITFVKRVYPSDANFILIKVDDANKRYTQLIKREIIVRNRSTLAGCENTLRITVGSSVENKNLIKTLRSLQ